MVVPATPGLIWPQPMPDGDMAIRLLAGCATLGSIRAIH
jgi:hypothetical protein